MMFNDRLEEEQLIAEERLAEGVSHELLEGTLRRLDSLHSVISLPETVTVADAVDEMISRRVGCVLVTGEQGFVGLFSERDVVVRVVGKRLDPSQVQLREVMTENPEVLRWDSKIVFALNKMTVGGFRHIPVVDGDGQPQAVVSMRDVVEHVVSFYADQVFNLPDPDAIPSAREGA